MGAGPQYPGADASSAALAALLVPPTINGWSVLWARLEDLKSAGTTPPGCDQAATAVVEQMHILRVVQPVAWEEWLNSIATRQPTSIGLPRHR